MIIVTIVLKIISALLMGFTISAIFMFACLGASYFFDSLNEYEQEEKYFIDEK